MPRKMIRTFCHYIEASLGASTFILPIPGLLVHLYRLLSKFEAFYILRGCYMAIRSVYFNMNSIDTDCSVFSRINFVRGILVARTINQ